MPQTLGLPRDYVTWYRSPSTGREFPVYTYVADVDFVTAGLFALTSIERPEIVRGEYTATEWNSWTRKTPFMAERRLNRRLKRTDLRAPVLIESGPHKYGYYKLFYRDLLGEGADGMKGEEAIPVREVSVAEFLASGGTIIDCPGRHRKAVPKNRKKAKKQAAKRKRTKPS